MSLSLHPRSRFYILPLLPPPHPAPPTPRPARCLFGERPGRAAPPSHSPRHSAPSMPQPLLPKPALLAAQGEQSKFTPERAAIASGNSQSGYRKQHLGSIGLARHGGTLTAPALRSPCWPGTVNCCALARPPGWQVATYAFGSTGPSSDPLETKPLAAFATSSVNRSSDPCLCT